MAEFGYCHCGCGQKTVVPTYTNRRDNRFKGIPLKFVRGHNSKIVDEHPNWKGGKTLSAGGYVYIFNPSHPDAIKTGYVMEHRVKMEEKIGRYLNKSEVVHHVNHIKTDNRIENLFLFDNHEKHAEYHLMEKALFECGDGNKRWCPYCKNYDSIDKLERRKSGKGYFHKNCRTKRRRDCHG